MKNLIASLCLLAFLFSFSSCKKDKDPTPQEMAAGKWKFETYQYNDHFGGLDHNYTMNGSADEYMDFRTDGKMYYFFAGGHDTLPYSVTSATHMILDGQTCQIQLLDSKNFKFYYKETSGSDFEEHTFTLKK